MKKKKSTELGIGHRIFWIALACLFLAWFWTGMELFDAGTWNF